MAYHTPRVYRSSLGCCICRAKSSSSRFACSSRFESAFVPCFKLEEPRYGEICNACVLLIKRYYKQEPGSDKDWRHVVDARARPRGRATVTRPNPKDSSRATKDAGIRKNRKEIITRRTNRDAASSPDDGPSTSSVFYNKFQSPKIGKHRYIPKNARAVSPSGSEDRYSEASSASRASSPSEYLPPRSGSARRKQISPSKDCPTCCKVLDSGFCVPTIHGCGCTFCGTQQVLVVNEYIKTCLNFPMESLRMYSSGSHKAIGASIRRTTSECGSLYEDDGMDSLDDTSSVEAFCNSPLEEEQRETSLLSQFAAFMT